MFGEVILQYEPYVYLLYILQMFSEVILQYEPYVYFFYILQMFSEVILQYEPYVIDVICSEWPMFCRNVDSFPFWQILGAPYVHFLAKVMPKISVIFGMTCARN